MDICLQIIDIILTWGLSICRLCLIVFGSHVCECEGPCVCAFLFHFPQFNEDLIVI